MSKKISNFLFFLFQNADMYGYDVHFYLKSHPKVKSGFGGFVSLLIMGFFLYSCCNTLISWRYNPNLQIIHSPNSFTVNELFNRNESSIFDFNYSTYGIYFMPFTTFPNGTMINIDAISRYVTPHFYFTDTKLVQNSIPFEKCLNRDVNGFLGQQVNLTDNSRSVWRLCYSKTLKMGFAPNVAQKSMNLSQLAFEIHKCKNSSSNKNFCASNEEIQAILPYFKIQVTLPKTVYDLNNFQHPRERSYQYSPYVLDFSLSPSLGSVMVQASRPFVRELLEQDEVRGAVLNADASLARGN